MITFVLNGEKINGFEPIGWKFGIKIGTISNHPAGDYLSHILCLFIISQQLLK